MRLQVDFKQINNNLRPFYASILAEICPGGKLIGKEYTAGDIYGGPGQSFRFNIETGMWADFAKNEKGSDIISLFAKTKGINNAEAVGALSESYLGRDTKHSFPVKQEIIRKLIAPPQNHKPPDLMFQKNKHTERYDYKNRDGDILFYIFRYDLPDGTKQFLPCTMNESGAWVTKAWQSPRPLFNLDKIFENPDKSILLVEGEKTALAAEKMLPQYVVTTWSGGAVAHSKSDFTPLYNRKVLLWPDGDEVGIKAMAVIASNLKEHCPVIKIINPDKNSGWDAADAYSEGMDTELFKKWVKDKITTIERTPQIKDAEVREISDTRSKSLVYIELGLTPISQKNPLPVCNMANATKLLNYIPKYAGKIWLDTFHQSIMTNYDGETRKWNDYDDIILAYDLQANWDMSKIFINSVKAAVSAVAVTNRRNELKDWLESLKWDGNSRTESFLTNTYGVENNDYVKAISKNWLIGLVARGIKPGCKFDEMLILEGPQGTYKSTSIKALAGKFAAESNADLSTKDFMQELTGTWIVEFDELDQFRKAESTLIKKKLSQQSDRLRPAYGHHVIDVPRTCVFVGTTNQSTYLKDETGGRRFWPICVKKADLNYILENREQLFAEAVTLFKQGHSWHEVPESAKQEQEARREQDPWEEVIGEYFYKNNGNIIIGNPNPPFEPMIGKLSAQNIAKYILNVPVERYDKSVSLRIGRCMRVFGYEMKAVRDDASQDLLGYGKVSKIFVKL